MNAADASIIEPDLRHKMRDLVALSALSSLWTGSHPGRIGASLADVLAEMLALEFVYIRLWNPDGTAPIEIGHDGAGNDVLTKIGELCRSFLPSLPFGTISSVIENPLHSGRVRITAVPIGQEAEWGVIVACAQRDPFPSETERLLLTVAANQSGVMIGHEQAAQQANAERGRLRDLLHQAPAAVAVLRGRDHIFEFVNPEYERAVGRRAAQLLGVPVCNAVPELVSQGFLRLLDGVYQTGEAVFGSEHLIKLKLDSTGTLTDRFFNFAFQPVRGAHGPIEGVFVHAVDVTEQVATRRRVEESEQQLRTLADSIPQLTWMAHPSGRAFWFNQRWYDYTGIPAARMEDRDWTSSIHDPAMLPLVKERWRDSLRTGDPFEMEYPLRGVDGSFRWFLTRAIPVRDADGAIVRWFGTSTDVTEIKRGRDERARLLAEEQDARATAELLNSVGPRLLSEVDIRNLAQAITDIATRLTGAEFGVFVHDLIRENGQGSSLTFSGIRPESLTTDGNTALLDLTFGGKNIVRCDDVAKEAGDGTTVAYQRLPEGFPRAASYLAARVTSRAGKVIGSLFFGHSLPGHFTLRHEAIITGIAAQAAIAMDNAQLFENSQRIQRELQRSNDELRRANQDLEAFAYSASHDLQEPLRNIAIYSQLLQKRLGEKLEEENASFLDGILAGAFRMETLIKDLLEYTRATKMVAGVPPIVNTEAVLNDVFESLKATIDQTGAIMVVDSLPRIAIQELHLSQLFQNLIGNALKYRNKEEPPRVHISAVNKDGSWVFSVSDNGIGIDPQYHSQIFGLFKRLNSPREYAGSGIGLAICQRIVEQYNGKIWVESRPGAGATFRFSVSAGRR